MKKPVVYLTLILLLAVFVTSVMSANTRMGRREFRYYCYKQCHYEGNSKTKVLTAASYTKMQWSYYFQNNMSQLKRQHPNGELKKVDISERTLENIKAYVRKHALDSARPETCGS